VESFGCGVRRFTPVPAIENPALAALQRRLDYTFRDAGLLTCAVTHPSYLQDHPEVTDSNQRLEFLGDAVLQFVLTEALFALFPEDREGSLSKRRSALSKGVFLSNLAREIDLPACLLLGSSEDQNGGRTRDAALEDALEAMIGALYLDSDLATVRRIVLGLIGSLSDRLAALQPTENPKGRLQELVQAEHGNHALRYEIIHTSGEDHAREYEATASLNGQLLGTGRGPSKKAAEEAAARVALTILQAGQHQT
jgi:ribonuclease III